jgi:NADH dehydrogenase
MEQMLRVIRRRKLIANIPFPVARIMALGFDAVNYVSFGLIPAQITRDQVKNLARDNVVAVGAKGLSDLGIRPTALEAVLPEYLWRFRPSGQYEDIKDSAKNLRT